MKLLEIFFIILFSKLQVSSSDDTSKYIRKFIKQHNSLDVGIHEVIIYNFGNQKNNSMVNDLMNQLTRFVPKQNPIVVAKSSDVSGRSESFRIIISDSHRLIGFTGSSKFWEISSKYIYLPISSTYTKENFLAHSEYFRKNGVLDFIAITNPSPGHLKIFTHNPFFNKTETFSGNKVEFSSIFPDKLKNLNGYEYQTIFLTIPGYLNYDNNQLTGEPSFFLNLLLKHQNAQLNVKNHSDFYATNFSFSNFLEVYNTGNYDLVLSSLLPRTENITEPICTYEPNEYCFGVPETFNWRSFEYFLVCPFTGEVQILLGVAVFLSALFWWFVSWRRIIRNPDSPGRLIFGVFGWFVGQDIGHRRLSFAQKCLAQVLVISLFFLSILYSTKLLSLQAVAKNVSEINNLDDIVKHQLPITANPFFYDSYVESGFNPEAAKLMTRQISPYKAYEALLRKEAIAGRCNFLKLGKKRIQTDHDDGNFKIIDEKLSFNFEYYFYHKLNPFRNKIKYYKDLVFEAALTHYYHLQEKTPIFSSKSDISRDSGNLIRFDDLYLTFMIYLGGCMLATLVFVGEIIWIKVSKAIKERREMSRFQYLP
jgi:hypothetical protein